MLEPRQLHVPKASTFDRWRLDFTHAILPNNDHWNRIDAS